MPSDESRILSLNNGLPDRQKRKIGAQNVTVDEVNDALARQGTELQRMLGHYMQQIPTLMQQMMAGMLAEFATHNGLTFPGQEPVTSGASESGSNDEKPRVETPDGETPPVTSP